LLFQRRCFISAATLIIYHVTQQFVKHFFNFFFFRFLPVGQACTFSKGARINLPQNTATRQLPH
ncbi:hypothetical protein, partial [Paenibacillus sp. AR247]|uniref:hypothetical protein n=1 Tax=Paenibacillus sp. AR247 TaxID=1631599 RepID=UPI001C612039